MQAKLRSDKRVKPKLLEYRILTNDECRTLTGHCHILDRYGDIAQVKITSVKTWKRRADIEVNCKYGMYEYLSIPVSDIFPNVQLIALV